MTTDTPTPSTLYEGTPVFTFSRAVLAEALSTVALAVPARPAVPVLGGVLLEGGADGVVKVSAFDYDMAVSVHIPDAAKTAGRMLLDHKELTKITKALVTGMRKREADALAVTIAADGAAAPTVEIAETTVPLRAHPVQEYPCLPEAPAAVARVDRDAFTREVTRVLRTVATEETHRMLTGLRTEFIPPGLVLTGTDRYRVAMAHVPAETEIAWKACTRGGALVPGHDLSRIMKTLSASSVDIGVEPAASPPWVSLSCGTTTVIMRCVDGEFPDLDKVMPTSATATITVDRAAVLTQAQRAAAVLAAKGESGRLSLLSSPEAVRVLPRLAEETYRVTTPNLPAEVAGIGDSESARIDFHPDFLIDALESVTTPTVTLHTQHPAIKPVVFTETPHDLTDTLAFRHVLMPIRP